MRVITRIQEDMQFVKKRRGENGGNGKYDDPVGRLLDLEKAYPRVSKPALWEFLERHGLKGNFMNCIIDLHETTEYCIMSKHGDSESGTPERGLEECPTSRVLFNIFHQMVIGLAEEKRREPREASGKKVGIEWHWLEGNKIPSQNQFGKYNSEAKLEIFSISFCRRFNHSWQGR